MTKKRPSIKGRGADMFLAESDAPRAETDAPVPPKAKPVKVTVYLSPSSADALNQAWLRRKMQDASVSKSQLVEEAVTLLLQQ